MLRLRERFVTRGILPVSLLCLAVAGCGGGSSPNTPDPTPPAGPTVTITSAGLSPRTLDVPLGSRITIVNNDTVSHDMGSDPHPSHEDCPELNQIGMLQAGQRRTSGNLVEARTCGMHDHLRPLVTSLHLRITIR